MSRLWDTDSRGKVTQRALQFLALTFVRTKELIEATWDEIDLDQARWLIGAPRMKMKRDFLVPLSTQAIALLREQQRTCRNSVYVWPGRNIRVPMSNNTLLFAGWCGRGSVRYPDRPYPDSVGRNPNLQPICGGLWSVLCGGGGEFLGERKGFGECGRLFL